MSLSALGPVADHALAFVLTYLIHSTVLIGAVFAIVRVLKPRSNPICEALWTVALFGGLVSTTLQMAAGVGSRAPTLELRRSAVTEEPAAPIRDALGEIPAKSLSEPQKSPSPNPLKPRLRDGAPSFPKTAATPSAMIPVGESMPASEPSAPRGAAVVGRSILSMLRSTAPLAIALGMLAGVIWLLALVLRSASALRERVPVVDGELFERLQALRQRLGIPFAVTLTMSRRIASPVAFGFSRREICVPARALEKLDSGQQEAMLAHELAHLVRRDPLRLVAARALESVLFFQPLHRLARRRLFEVIELRCDAFAVERLGAGLALAGCLAEVASWIHDAPHRSLAPAMAEFGSSLGRRIEGLLDEDRTLERERRQRGFAPFVFLVLPFVAAGAPAVAVAVASPAKRVSPSPEHASKPAPSPKGDAADTLDDAIASLDSDIVGLIDEIHDLKTKDVRGVAGARETLTRIESQLALVERLRAALIAQWQARSLRTAAGTETPSETNNDRSNSRRKP